ncbi:hypothetical protein E4U42_008043 [Claviceps africana]|uniref:DUF453-domain-containing protein n=1 Tax=Claviceps africana TaxID=83212 RepID=A0A8K0NNF4_9HYPO|nr:hypothetical protein E4U42_008043 [Claviceps africana]
MTVREKSQFKRLRRCDLPCTLMRAGTSKALFVHRRHLPADISEWERHLVSALGSRGDDARQIDGVGGGASTTSKVAVVAPSKRPSADVEWTFVQVAVGRESIDMTGTCGNVSSGVGPFALQNGLATRRPGDKTMDIRVYNTNTDSIVVETVQLDHDGDFLETGTYTMPGVPVPGSEIKCRFEDPAGSMTGTLFPSGRRQQVLSLQPQPHLPPCDVPVTLIDAANPFVFVDGASLSGLQSTFSERAFDALVERIRQEAAVAMGLASTADDAAKTRGTPKVALLYRPGPGPDRASIRVQSYSMGRPHPSFQLTGAVCLATALTTPGTIAADLAAARPPNKQTTQRGRDPRTPPASPRVTKWTIAHAKGVIDVDVFVRAGAGADEVRACAVSRTARRLFAGTVSYYI